MGPGKKIALLGLGGLAGILILSQFLLGRMLAAGNVQFRTAHQHTGYLTVAVVLLYVIVSIVAIARLPRRDGEITPRP